MYVSCMPPFRYHQHQTDFEELPVVRPVPQKCEVSGCPCGSYHYSPMVGNKFVLCSCHHTPKEHDPNKPFKCATC